MHSSMSVVKVDGVPIQVDYSVDVIRTTTLGIFINGLEIGRFTTGPQGVSDGSMAIPPSKEVNLLCLGGATFQTDKPGNVKIGETVCGVEAAVTSDDPESIRNNVGTHTLEMKVVSSARRR